MQKRGGQLQLLPISIAPIRAMLFHVHFAWYSSNSHFKQCLNISICFCLTSPVHFSARMTAQSQAWLCPCILINTIWVGWLCIKLSWNCHPVILRPWPLCSGRRWRDLAVTGWRLCRSAHWYALSVVFRRLKTAALLYASQMRWDADRVSYDRINTRFWDDWLKDWWAPRIFVLQFAV